jgi:5-methyltetrahydrofolate--homocysteine methyltransferase
MNPLDPWMMETLAASELLSGRDPGGSRFIAGAQGFLSSRRSPGAAAESPRSPEKKEAALLPEGPYRNLGTAILEGDALRAGSLAGLLLDEGASPLSVVNEGVIPALEAVGEKYDRGEFFLPQLISSAEAARTVCDRAMELLAASGGEPRGRILLATVEGDLHDLGKNVVATILRSHGYLVTDLGKDIPCSVLLDEAEKGQYDVIGLSALMTSTMRTMAAAVSEIRRRLPEVFVLVGGASVSASFADSIGAHGFAPDAVSTVRLVESLLGGQHEEE